ncbi:putative gpi anchored protein [Botrytis fragariae]|uniref:Putative gpi anchored protein n=1 Tax=Botrytis fragariae TaxID=1964551 RepID=A0A8H6ATD7_9HELO|nr:putative gpi anchored protein [Botrytis fragariae]KAF5873238.1 putative gpi anchored protein [Botrytis fragariae]
MYTTTSLSALVALSLPLLSTAHFLLSYPASRGFNEDTLSQFPCGGQDTVSSNRTLWPLSGGSIALDMEDASANIEVLIAFGNNVGSAFNTVLRQTFAETGTGSFCMQDLVVDGVGWNVTEGMNATIQVVTGEAGTSGGLYNCADITFSKNVSMSVGSCSNATDVKTTAATVTGNPNTTSTSTESSSGVAAFGGNYRSVGLVAAGIVIASLW